MPPRAPAHRWPFLATYEAPGWSAAVAAHVGLARPRMEDAWAAALDLRTPRGPLQAVAVFDGLGGLPHGEEAAWAAAGALPGVLARGTAPADVLGRLHQEVTATGGMTTAVIALALPGSEGVEVLTVGDSSGFALDAAGALVQVVPHDVDADGLTACLGNEPLRTQRRPWPLPRGTSLLVCTDGVDRVVDPAVLQRVLQAPPAQVERALASLIEAVLDGKAPDNAAAVLLHRRA